jgi:hypothetical protein
MRQWNSQFRRILAIYSLVEKVFVSNLGNSFQIIVLNVRTTCNDINNLHILQCTFAFLHFLQKTEIVYLSNISWLFFVQDADIL